MILDRENKLELIEVSIVADLEEFIKLPFYLYQNDPNWVAPLIVERKQFFNIDKNPYFNHAKVRMWIVKRSSKTVGRISAQVCENNQKLYGNIGQFGFLEAENDPDIFLTLFAAAISWLEIAEVKKVYGPFNFSVNDEVGILVDGFNFPPVIMMGHSLPYYDMRIKELGFTKVKDVLAYRADLSGSFPEGILSKIDKLSISGDLIIRNLSKKRLHNDLDIIISIFNDAWQGNWGFVPMTPEEINHLGNNLKLLVDEECIAIANYKGEDIAMLVSLPNINEILANLNGHLFPFGFIKLLWGLKISCSYNSVRVPLMGVKRKYQKTRIGSLITLSLINKVWNYHKKRGVKWAELSWILENNMPMRHMLDYMNCDPYKTYRIYERDL